MSEQREKLELQPKVPVTVTLLYDTPKTGQGQYGPYWMFGISHDGRDKIFFANEDVASVLQHYKKGDSVTLMMEPVLLPTGKAVKRVTVLDGTKGSPQENNLQENNLRDRSRMTIFEDCLREAQVLVSQHPNLMASDITPIAVALYMKE